MDTLENEAAGEPVVRNLRPSDMDAVVRLDARVTGRSREEYFRTKLAMALADTGVEVSLAAEVDGCFVGFLLARVYYGEFGSLEQTAVLDTLDVDPDFRGQGVGRALMGQLRQNLRALMIGTLRTEIEWGNMDLMAFFQREGFQPAPRLCLDLPLEE